MHSQKEPRSQVDGCKAFTIERALFIDVRGAERIPKGKKGFKGAWRASFSGVCLGWGLQKNLEGPRQPEFH